eukprot:CAMPEP_0183736344 /NCGR_PEP_ID=MMETSP0737-20130205/49041_1 /TAXON_ID=385413 /ORGANISM="Thalassiosira miniscula, Strain CCMP1093" /LENGTH=410 /DNA_ID=CAMNT_0025970313 /DNA_START=273 /DNA_END=1505 /DNA_ORIENTATION=+
MTNGSSGGENYLLRDEPKNCRRKCIHYQSKILYAEPTDGGLEDRIRVINALSNLAAFLCAELYLKPPSDLLQPYHNANERLGGALKWSDFLQATHIGQSKSPMYELHTQASSSFESESTNHSGLHIITTEWWKGNEDFKKIHNASFMNNTFLWEIRLSWWDMVAKYKGVGLNNLGNIIDDIIPKQQSFSKEEYISMLPTESKFPSLVIQAGEAFLADVSYGCTYIKLDYSSTIKLMQRHLEDEIRRQYTHQDDYNNLLGLLHLRRGDTTQICDTSLEKVRSYLNCSLGRVEVHGDVTLVMTSDEKDVNYRNDIMGLVGEFGHLTIIDGDNITQGIIDDALKIGHIRKSMVNGFVEFAVEGALRSPESELVDFRLTRRRGHCPQCDPAVYQALDPTTTYRFRGDQLHMTPV